MFFVVVLVSPLVNYPMTHPYPFINPILSNWFGPFVISNCSNSTRVFKWALSSPTESFHPAPQSWALCQRDPSGHLHVHCQEAEPSTRWGIPRLDKASRLFTLLHGALPSVAACQRWNFKPDAAVMCDCSRDLTHRCHAVFYWAIYVFSLILLACIVIAFVHWQQLQIDKLF